MVDGRRAREIRCFPSTDALLDVLAIAEFVPGYVATGWYGICTPTGTPAAIIDRLSGEITAGVAAPDLKARLLALGVEPTPMTPAEFGKFIADETEKWGKVIRAASIKPE